MLPVDGEDWEEVARLHNLNFPTNGRDSVKLKCKFQQNYWVEMPTGVPMCPREIPMAKRIREQIRDKAEIDDGEGELLLQDPSFQEDVEGQPFDPLEDLSDGEEGGGEESTEHNNNVNNENFAVGVANNGNPNQVAAAATTTNKFVTRPGSVKL